MNCPTRRNSFQQACFSVLLLAAFSAPLIAQQQPTFRNSTVAPGPKEKPPFPPSQNSDRAQQAAAPSIPLEGLWHSNWGAVTFRNVVRQPDGTFAFTGDWDQSAGRGTIINGTFYPQTGKLTFRYFQPWNNDYGEGRFQLLETAEKLFFQGSYNHDSSFSGGWDISRDTPTPCPFVDTPTISTAYEEALASNFTDPNKVTELLNTLVAKATGLKCDGAAGTVLSNTQHGDVRLTERGFSAEDIEFTKSGEVIEQADGAKVYIKETSPGRFNLIVEGDRGIITGMKGLSRGSLDRLAKNYGWKL